MRYLWQRFCEAVCCYEIQRAHQALTQLTGRVEHTTSGPPTAVAPAPQVADELQVLEDHLKDQLRTSVQQGQLPPQTRAIFVTFKGALDRLQASLRAGRPIDPQDLHTFQQQAQQLGQILAQARGDTMTTQAPAQTDQPVPTDPGQQTALINNPHTSLDTLFILYIEGATPEIRQEAHNAMLERARTSQDPGVLAELAGGTFQLHPIPDAVASNPHTPAVALRLLHECTLSPSLDLALANNPSTPDDVLQDLMQQGATQEARNAAQAALVRRSVSR